MIVRVHIGKHEEFDILARNCFNCLIRDFSILVYAIRIHNDKLISKFKHYKMNIVVTTLIKIDILTLVGWKYIYIYIYIKLNLKVIHIEKLVTSQT